MSRVFFYKNKAYKNIMLCDGPERAKFAKFTSREIFVTLGVETFAWRNFRAFRGFELDTRKFIHA